MSTFAFGDTYLLTHVRAEMTPCHWKIRICQEIQLNFGTCGIKYQKKKKKKGYFERVFSSPEYLITSE